MEFHKAERFWFVVEGVDGKKISVSGLELIKVAYDAFAMIYNELERKTSLHQVINQGQDWLHTAGRLSRFATAIDKKESLIYPCTLDVYGTPVIIKNASNKDAYVDFSGKGDYVTITQKLRSLSEQKEFNFLEITQFLFFGVAPEFDVDDYNKNSHIAQALLKRIAGHPYPDNLQEFKTYLDTLLTLLIGVEGSRNNASFLCCLLHLDLIAGNHTYGKLSHAFNWDNAFISGQDYRWNDAENLNLGGKNSMATNGTGNGNMMKRREIVSKIRSNSSPGNINLNLQIVLRHPQHHRVIWREMSLLVTWLTRFHLLSENSPFSRVRDKSHLLNIIRDQFVNRLRVGFRDQRGMPQLPPNLEGYSRSRSMQFHEQHDPYVFFLTHQYPDTNRVVRNDNYYHRVDWACKLTTEYAMNGTLRKGIRSTLHIVRKLKTGLIREYKPDQKKSSLSSLIQFDWPDIIILDNKGQPFERLPEQQAQIYYQIIADYARWLLAIFNFESLKDSLEMTTVARAMRPFQYFEQLTMPLLKKLSWKVVDENKSIIDKAHLASLALSDEKTASFWRKLLNEGRIDLYCDAFLTVLQRIIDPLKDNPIMIVNESLTYPDSDTVRKKFADLVVRYSATSFPYLSEVCKLLTLSMGFFNYDIIVNQPDQRTPCPHCYNKKAELMRSKPVPQNAMTCFIDTRPGQGIFHFIGSKCHEQLRPSDNQFMFIQNASDSHSRHPCRECWSQPTPYVAPKPIDSDASVRQLGRFLSSSPIFAPLLTVFEQGVTACREYDRQRAEALRKAKREREEEEDQHGTQSDSQKQKIESHFDEVSVSNNNYFLGNVPGDGSCMLYAICLGALLPAILSDGEFNAIVSKLFGNRSPDDILSLKNGLKMYNGSLETVKQHCGVLINMMETHLRPKLAMIKEEVGLASFQTEQERELASIKDQNEWGDHIEIAAFALLLEREIHVFRFEDDAFKYHDEQSCMPKTAMYPPISILYSNMLDWRSRNGLNHYRLLITPETFGFLNTIPTQDNFATQISAGPL
jgi:hypothetical protein